MRTRFLTITKYYQDINVNKAKGRYFPEYRGTWLPCVDIQIDGGIAINWLGVRVRVSARKSNRIYLKRATLEEMQKDLIMIKRELRLDKFNRIKENRNIGQQERNYFGNWK